MLYDIKYLTLLFHYSLCFLVFNVLNFSLFQLEIQSPDEKRLFLATCMAFYSQPVTYEEDMEFGSTLSQGQRESMITRFRFKPGNDLIFV